jgi:two-component system LytT family response regulator
MRFKTILVDDEPLALNRLRRLLEPHRAVIEIVAEAADGDQALGLIDELRPDLVFLDIQMPGLSGFEVLSRLSHLPLVIFSTAYDQYALQAFETNSIDYLLKPVDPERLARAIDKLTRVTRDGEERLRTQLRSLMSGLQGRATQRIQVRVGDRIRFVDICDVVFFQAKGKYVELHTVDASYLINQPLKVLEQELPSGDFVRVHRSAIVNMSHVDEVTRSFKGAYVVRMKDHRRSELPVSRHCKAKLGLS